MGQHLKWSPQNFFFSMHLTILGFEHDPCCYCNVSQENLFMGRFMYLPSCKGKFHRHFTSWWGLRWWSPCEKKEIQQNPHRSHIQVPRQEDKIILCFGSSNTIESWKSPLRLSIQQSLQPRPPLNYVPRCHIYRTCKCLQGWWLHLF